MAAQGWCQYEETQAFLVALDISGFSRHMQEPDQLLAHRMRFFKAIEQTRLMSTAQTTGVVAVHFLGDELRLAFQRSVPVRDVDRFLDDVLAALDQINRHVAADRQTRVKGTVLAGVVSWENWHGCSFLEGDLPFKAQRWMGHLQPGEIATDEEFKHALAVAGLPTGRLLPRDFDGEPGYVLKGGK